MNEIEVKCPKCQNDIKYSGQRKCPSCLTIFSEDAIHFFEESALKNSSVGEPKQSMDNGSESNQSNDNAAAAETNQFNGSAEVNQDTKSENSLVEEAKTGAKCPYCKELIDLSRNTIKCPLCRTRFTERDLIGFENQPDCAVSSVDGFKPPTPLPPAEKPTPVVESTTQAPVTESKKRLKLPQPKALCIKPQDSPIKAMYSATRKNFNEGQEYEVCNYILEHELIADIIGENEQNTELLDKLAKQLDCEDKIVDARLEGKFSFYFVMYGCLLAGKLAAGERVPLYFGKELYAYSQSDFLQKAHDRRISAATLKKLSDSGVIKAYLLVDDAESGLMQRLCSGNGYYHVDEKFNIKKVASTDAELFSPDNFLLKYDIIKALDLRPCGSFDMQASVDEFYSNNMSAMNAYGCKSPADLKKLFFLLSVCFNEKGIIKIAEKVFVKNDLLLQAQNIIVDSVSQNDARYFIVLRALLKANVFGYNGSAELGELNDIIVAHEDPLSSLAEAYYCLSHKKIKRIFYERTFTDLNSLAVKLSKQETVEGALRDKLLLDGFEKVYQKDLSGFISMCETKCAEVIKNASLEFDRGKV